MSSAGIFRNFYKSRSSSSTRLLCSNRGGYAFASKFTVNRYSGQIARCAAVNHAVSDKSAGMNSSLYQISSDLPLFRFNHPCSAMKDWNHKMERSISRYLRQLVQSEKSVSGLIAAVFMILQMSCLKQSNSRVTPNPNFAICINRFVIVLRPSSEYCLIPASFLGMVGMTEDFPAMPCHGNLSQCLCRVVGSRNTVEQADSVQCERHYLISDKCGERWDRIIPSSCKHWPHFFLVEANLIIRESILESAK